jgi:hypothetical protein
MYTVTDRSALPEDNYKPQINIIEHVHTIKEIQVGIFNHFALLISSYL